MLDLYVGVNRGSGTLARMLVQLQYQLHIHKDNVCTLWQAEALNDTLRDTLNQLLVEAGHVPEKTTALRAAQPSRPLPR